MEGFLPLSWCVFWALLSLPFLIFGMKAIGKIISVNPRFKMLLVFAGAFTFVLSALKIPSVTGSCSHPTGVGLGAILFGPTTMTVLSSIVLLFQAVLLAHGGLTTLGANIFSMGIVGPFVAYWLFKLSRKLKAPMWLAILLAATLGNLMTYITTSFQLALAFPAENGGIIVSLIKFLGIFAVTQIPLAISEGILTIVVFNVLMVSSFNELQELKVIPREAK
jgi:cobalt/nickel transport system permease protein